MATEPPEPIYKKQLEDLEKSKADTIERLEKKKTEIVSQISGVASNCIEQVDDMYSLLDIYDYIWNIFIKYFLVYDTPMGDIKMIFASAKAFSFAVFKGLLHILQKAFHRMIAEPNPLILIPQTIAGFTTLCGIATGIQISTTLMIISFYNKVMEMVVIPKMKLKLLTTEIGSGTPSKMVLDASQTSLKKLSEELPKIVEKALNKRIDKYKKELNNITITPPVSLEDGTITSEAEDNFNKEYKNKMKDYSSIEKRSKAEFDSVSAGFPNVEQLMSGILTGIYQDVNYVYSKTVPNLLSSYDKIALGIANAESNYTKLIASKFTDAKAGGNPTIEELVYPEDPEDEEMKEILKMLEEVSPEDSKQISESMKAEFKKAEEAKKAAEEAAAKDKKKKEAEQAAAQASIDAAKAAASDVAKPPAPPAIDTSNVKPNTKFLKEIQDATTTFNKVSKDYGEKVKILKDKVMNMEVEAEIAEIKTLALEKTYDVLKKMMR